MNKERFEPAVTPRLRVEAEERIRTRNAPPSKAWPLGVETLQLLYRLASDPDRAPDALKLLHELQVHQVELDLVHQEIEASHAALTVELGQYKAAYEFAPVGLFIVNLDGAILEVNPAGARLLGIDRSETAGRNLADLLAAHSRPVLEGLVNGLREGQEPASCELETATLGGHSTRLRVKARVLPGRQSVLIVGSD